LIFGPGSACGNCRNLFASGVVGSMMDLEVGSLSLFRDRRVLIDKQGSAVIQFLATYDLSDAFKVQCYVCTKKNKI
jgi:hypothetical protein